MWGEEKMKKKLIVVLTLVISVMFFGMTNVEAYTKEDLREKLIKTYRINGSEFKASPAQIAELDRYLKVNGLSDEDALYISNKIDEAIALVEAGTAKEFKYLTVTEKQKLIAMVADISNNTSVKAALTDGGVLTIYNNDGTIFTKISDLIKYTNNTNYILLLTGFVSLIGLIIFIKGFNKANA